MEESCEFDDTQILEAIQRMMFAIGALDEKIEDLATDVRRIRRTVESLQGR